MATLVINNAVINGTVIGIEDFVNGTGWLIMTGSDVAHTTLDHRIHNVRTTVHYNARFKLYGDYSSLDTSDTAADTDNFGGTHTLKYDSTTIATFKGVVTTEYNKDDRITEIQIRGEADGTS